jgi:hypothetical protein
MTRIAAMIVTAAGAFVVTTGLAPAESPYGVHDYWSRVERAQECAWGGRAYAWGAAEYPCWNTAPRYYGGWQRPPAYRDGYGWR